MKPNFLLLAGFLLAATCFASDEGMGWRPLFNGRDLSGWELFLGIPHAAADVPGAERDAKGNHAKPLGINNDPLRVVTVVEADGRPAIRLGTEAPGGLTTVESFGNYHLKMQFKWGEKKKGVRNAGFLYHAFGPPGDVQGRWMHSHQFQIKEGSTGDYIAMGRAVADVTARKIDEKRLGYDPAAPVMTFGSTAPLTPNCARLGEDREKAAGEWNTLEIYAVGDAAVQVVNGGVVFRLSHSRQVDGSGHAPLVSGRLQLQMEGTELFFRDIEIRPLRSLPAGVAAP
jgi:hypothetical protein